MSDTKRATTFQGLPVHIEIEAGATYGGTDDLGQDWEHTYQFPYGEIPRTEGDDGDPVDVYLGPSEQAPQVFVVHQLTRDGAHDEDKVMLGFENAEDAEHAYKKHGPPFGFGSMDAMTLDQFKNGYLAANRAPAAPMYDSAAARENAGRTRYGTP